MDTTREERDEERGGRGSGEGARDLVDSTRRMGTWACTCTAKRALVLREAHVSREPARGEHMHARLLLHVSLARRVRTAPPPTLPLHPRHGVADVKAAAPQPAKRVELLIPGTPRSGHTSVARSR